MPTVCTARVSPRESVYTQRAHLQTIPDALMVHIAPIDAHAAHLPAIRLARNGGRCWQWQCSAQMAVLSTKGPQA